MAAAMTVAVVVVHRASATAVQQAATDSAMTCCYIGLGANIDDPVHQLELALQALSALPQTELVRISSLYGSRPLGPEDQPDYVNAVAEIDTQLDPLALLDALQNQEQQQGRIKRRHWGERCIDLDLLLYGSLTMDSERLTIPHKELHKRSFVVEPLREIAPGLHLPDGTAIAELEPEFGGELHRISALSVDL
jgi:2-amino-4-hydroxy-6-hydroxymethyldihydropteridine diphosphokinase